MATPIQQSQHERTARPAPITELIPCRHGVKWVVDVASGRVVRKPCQACLDETVPAAEA